MGFLSERVLKLFMLGVQEQVWSDALACIANDPQGIRILHPSTMSCKPYQLNQGCSLNAVEYIHCVIVHLLRVVRLWTIVVNLSPIKHFLLSASPQTVSIISPLARGVTQMIAI